MSKRLFEIAGVAYVCFSLLAAYTSLAPTETTSSSSSHIEANMATPERPLFNSERLDYANENTNYTVRVWTARWCGPCKRYKANEVPQLVKAGFTVEVLDIDKEVKPAYIQRIPTVELLYEGKTLTRKTYWRAEDIEDFVNDLNPMENNG